MKKISIIAVLVLAVAVWSCSDVRRTPGRVYMPDMNYSRAIETYAPIDTLGKQGIFYNRMPVAGTIKRGEVMPFTIPQDKAGDSINYLASRQVANPLPALNAAQMKEAERLYLVNCGICHGTALDGNGPLYNGGNGPYAAAPKNLMKDPVVSKMPSGQMFYSVTYGKGQMGSYASQLSTTQRWMVIHYIKTKQGGEQAPAADSTAAQPAAGVDSASANPGTNSTGPGTGVQSGTDTATKK